MGTVAAALKIGQQGAVNGRSADDRNRDMIQIENVRYRYPKSSVDALASVSLIIGSGNCFGLLGPNGAGKSTLLALLTGALRLQSGEIRIDGRSVCDAPEAAKHRAALVPQDLAFYPSLTGRENLAFFAGIQGLSGAASRAALARSIEICALGAVVDQRAETYSGGLRRRLNLAIGLASVPSILYLDEPTVGIDAFSRDCIRAAIRDLRAAGTTIVYTSHYMEEVEALCDELAVLDRGRLIARAATEALLGRAAERRLELVFEQPPAEAPLGALSGLDATWLDPRRVVIAVDDERRVADILSTLATEGHAINRVAYGFRSLEEVYRALLAEAA